MKHRLLYLPYGKTKNDGIGFRLAFELLRERGALAALETFSFQRDANEHGWDAMLERLMALAESFQPTAILWQHQNTGPVPPAMILRLHALSSAPVIVQFTGDSYRRPPKQMVELGRSIDVTLLLGTALVPAFRRKRCKDVRSMTNWFSRRHWSDPPPRRSAPDFDVVMIANHYRQIFFRRFAGQTDRLKLVRAFSKHYGERFGIYGHGWEGYPCAQGFIPNVRQQEAMANARLILAANNWHHAHYFSDRLLISLASRVPVLHKWFEGADDYFEEGRHLWYFRTPSEALAKADMILALPEAERERVANAGAEEAIRNHSCDFHAERFLGIFDELNERRDGK